jgi:hypothetical protein
MIRFESLNLCTGRTAKKKGAKATPFTFCCFLISYPKMGAYHDEIIMTLPNLFFANCGWNNRMVNREKKKKKKRKKRKEKEKKEKKKKRKKRKKKGYLPFFVSVGESDSPVVLMRFLFNRARNPA